MTTGVISEDWKDVVGYDGLYRISNTGRVHVLRRFRNGHWYKEWFTSGFFDAYGYLRVALTDDNHQKRYYKVHQLVAMHFVDNPHNYKVVNHLDGVKINNNHTNLEWTTLTWNNIHAYEKLGKCLKGHRNGRATLTEQQAREIKRLSKNISTDRQLAAKYNTHWRNIQNIRCGWTWKHIKA